MRCFSRQPSLSFLMESIQHTQLIWALFWFAFLLFCLFIWSWSLRMHQQRVTANLTLKFKNSRIRSLSDTDNPCRSFGSVLSSVLALPSWLQVRDKGADGRQTQKYPETEETKFSLYHFLRAVKPFPGTSQHTSSQISLVRILSFVYA